MNFFKNVKSLEDLKKQYKELAKKFHPDLGGSKEQMQQLNEEYEGLLNTGHFNFEKTSISAEKELREVIEKIVVLDNIVIEICGTWIWVSGETYPVKDSLKKAGFKFAGKKKKWYYSPEGTAKKKRRGSYSMDKIRKTYGSKVVSGRRAIAA